MAGEEQARGTERTEEGRWSRRRAESGRASRLALGLAALALVTSELASAQSRTFYLDRVQLGGAPGDGLMVWRPEFTRTTSVYGAFAVGYALDPLRKNSVAEDPKTLGRMENLITQEVDIYALAGVQLFGRASLGVALPAALLQVTGSDPSRYGVGGGGLSDAPAALMDLRLDARVKLYEDARRTLRVGAYGELFFPTGNRQAFTSDGRVTGGFLGSIEWAPEPVILSFMVGPEFRPANGIGGLKGTLSIGDELRFAGGAFLPLRSDTLRVGVEVWGTTGLSENRQGESTFFDKQNTAVEWLGEARFALNEARSLYAQGGVGTRLTSGYGAADFRALAMVGGAWTPAESRGVSRAPELGLGAIAPPKDTDRDGYPDSIDACPTEAEDEGAPLPYDGCPTRDADRDGLADTADACPEGAEDLDGVTDEDGCPEEDRDRDTISDAEDRCPTQAGPASPNAAEHGCPTGAKFEEGTTEIVLLRPVQFETARAVIREESFPVLDEVVAVLASHPELAIAVHGHTDNRGVPAANRRLSEARAAAVVAYLVAHGIGPERLQSFGFGADQPVDTNTTAEGRAQNRRVELHVVGGAAAAPSEIEVLRIE